MILDDGYTETLEAHPQFRFRRFLASEKKHFRGLLEQENYSAAREFFARHVSDPDGRRISTELIPEKVAYAATDKDSEADDLANLKSGFRLLLVNPRLAIRPCALCQKYWFDEDTGTIVEHGGKKLLRPDYAVTKCQTEQGCARGTPENLKALNNRNQKAFDHWMQWKAVGCPDPQDAIIRRNWMLFESMKEHHGFREICNRVSQSAVRGRPVLHGVR